MFKQEHKKSQLQLTVNASPAEQKIETIMQSLWQNHEVELLIKYLPTASSSSDLPVIWPTKSIDTKSSSCCNSIVTIWGGRVIPHNP